MSGQALRHQLNKNPNSSGKIRTAGNSICSDVLSTPPNSWDKNAPDPLISAGLRAFWQGSFHPRALDFQEHPSSSAQHNDSRLAAQVQSSLPHPPSPAPIETFLSFANLPTSTGHFALESFCTTELDPWPWTSSWPSPRR